MAVGADNEIDLEDMEIDVEEGFSQYLCQIL